MLVVNWCFLIHQKESRALAEIQHDVFINYSTSDIDIFRQVLTKKLAASSLSSCLISPVKFY